MRPVHLATLQGHPASQSMLISTWSKSKKPTFFPTIIQLTDSAKSHLPRLGSSFGTWSCESKLENVTCLTTKHKTQNFNTPFVHLFLSYSNQFFITSDYRNYDAPLAHEDEQYAHQVLLTSLPQSTNLDLVQIFIRYFILLTVAYYWHLEEASLNSVQFFYLLGTRAK